MAQSSTASTPDPGGQQVVESPSARVSHRPRLDIALLRVVAICGVVLVHVCGLTTRQDRLRGTTVWWLAEVLNVGSRFCVPLFVMVSGALLLRPGSTERTGDFYRRRLTRLLPALFVWYAVYAVFTAVVLERPANPTLVIALVLAGKTYTALYFFWLILGLYLVTPALRVLLRGLSQERLLAAGLGLSALSCAWESTSLLIEVYTPVDATASPNAFSYWIPYVGYFVLGAALAQRTFTRSAIRWAAPALVASTAVTLWVETGHAPRWFVVFSSSSYHGWLVAAATVSVFVLGCAVCAGADTGVGPLARFVNVLGGVTLGVFALHLLVLYALQHAGLFTVTQGATRLLELGYLAGATLVLSFAAAWLLSQVPGLRRLV